MSIANNQLYDSDLSNEYLVDFKPNPLVRVNNVGSSNRYEDFSAWMYIKTNALPRLGPISSNDDTDDEYEDSFDNFLKWKKINK
jgi:hypothetical protein